MSYGLYVLTARESDKDNGCIIDAAVQVARDPSRLAISVQKENLTGEMIRNTGVFNLSVLTVDTPLATFRHFGMQSGRDVDKFAQRKDTERSENGLLYLTENTNAMFSCKVLSATDMGSHILFVGEVTRSKVLGSGESCTYAYYRKAIKTQ